MGGADYALAFSAGAISFLSPCVLPLVPVYLSVTTGLDVAELSRGGRGRAATVTRGAGLFILGFSVVFVALGLSATAVGSVLLEHQVPITRLAGVVVILMAVAMLLGTTTRGLWVSRERRFHPDPLRRRMWAAPVTGAAFAFGWTPCIGPVLGSVLAVAAVQGGVLRGGVLLAAYSAGLAVPLLLTGLAFHRAIVPMRWTRRHALGLSRTVAVLLFGYGILLALDRLSWLTQTLQTSLTASG
jgi:cytochrome c-type biogenesis protein